MKINYDKINIQVDEVDTTKIKQYEQKIESYIESQTHCAICEKETSHLKSFNVIKEGKIKVMALCESCHKSVKEV